MRRTVPIWPVKTPPSLGLKHGALRRLRQLLVARVGHVLPELDQDRLHGELALPLREAGQLGRVHRAVALVDARQVHLAHELDLRRLIGVVRAAVHLDRVDAVLVDAL